MLAPVLVRAVSWHSSRHIARARTPQSPAPHPGLGLRRRRPRARRGRARSRPATPCTRGATSPAGAATPSTSARTPTSWCAVRERIRRVSALRRGRAYSRSSPAWCRSSRDSPGGPAYWHAHEARANERPWTGRSANTDTIRGSLSGVDGFLATTPVACDTLQLAPDLPPGPQGDKRGRATPHAGDQQRGPRSIGPARPGEGRPVVAVEFAGGVRVVEWIRGRRRLATRPEQAVYGHMHHPAHVTVSARTSRRPRWRGAWSVERMGVGAGRTRRPTP